MEIPQQAALYCKKAILTQGRLTFNLIHTCRDTNHLAGVSQAPQLHYSIMQLDFGIHFGAAAEVRHGRAVSCCV